MRSCGSIVGRGGIALRTNDPPYAKGPGGAPRHVGGRRSAARGGRAGTAQPRRGRRRARRRGDPRRRRVPPAQPGARAHAVARASGRPRAALTFDDGPGPSTPDVLDALAREGVRATFFVLGRQAERHPETVRRIATEGHQVANHGYDHGILIFRGAAHVRDQLARCEAAVAAAAGPDAMTPLFRAPHGSAAPRPPSPPTAPATGWRRGPVASSTPPSPAPRRSPAGPPGRSAPARSCCCTTRTGGCRAAAAADGRRDRRHLPGRAGARPGAGDARRAGGVGMTTDTTHRLRKAQRRLSSPYVKIALIAVVGAGRRVEDRPGRGAGRLHDHLVGLPDRRDPRQLRVGGLQGARVEGVVDALPGMRRRTRYRDILPPLFIGFLFNTVLAARLGEVVKVMLLRRRLERRGERPPTTTLLGTVVAENLVSTITWVGLVVAIGLFLPLPSYAVVRLDRSGRRLPDDHGGGAPVRPGKTLPPWLNAGTLWARVRRAVSRLWGAVRESHLGLRDPRQMSLVVGASLLDLAGAVDGDLLHALGVRAGARRLGRRRAAARDRHPRAGLPRAPRQPGAVPGGGGRAADRVVRRAPPPRRWRSRWSSRPRRPSSASPWASSS